MFKCNNSRSAREVAQGKRGQATKDKPGELQADDDGVQQMKVFAVILSTLVVIALWMIVFHRSDLEERIVAQAQYINQLQWIVLKPRLELIEQLKAERDTLKMERDYYRTLVLEREKKGRTR